MHTQEPNQAAYGDTSRLDVTSPVAVEQEVEANASRLNALDQVLPGDSDQRLFRGQSELASKPPRPAASSLAQQGGAKTGAFGLPASGGLQDRTSSKTSMMSAGSGYQADSDSNSDVQLEPQRSSLDSQTSPQLAQASSTTPEHESAASAPPPESTAAAKEAETEAEPEAKSGTHTSILGKLGDTVWGAVEAITGHSTDSTAAEKSGNGEAEDQQLQAEALPKASQQAGDAETGTAAGDEAAQQPQLTKADSGYEGGEEGPVQAGPEGNLQHSPGQEAEQGSMGMATAPVGHSSSVTDRQTQSSSSWTDHNEPQLGSESAASAPPPESAAAATEAETEAEPEAKSGTHTSILGKLGDTVWGAVEAITGHSTDSTAAEKGGSGKAEDQQLQAESLPKASQQADHAKTGTAAGDESAQQPQLTKADSGYEGGEEGPVQAGPEGTLQHSPDQGAEQSSMSMATAPVGHSSGVTDRQTQPSSSWMDYNEPQLGSESAAESGAQHGVLSPSQQPLHVQTDAASSKRGIRGVGDNQPGSASKRPRGESAVSKLINSFDSPRSGTFLVQRHILYLPDCAYKQMHSAVFSLHHE